MQQSLANQSMWNIIKEILILLVHMANAYRISQADSFLDFTRYSIFPNFIAKESTDSGFQENIYLGICTHNKTYCW